MGAVDGRIGARLLGIVLALALCLAACGAGGGGIPSFQGPASMLKLLNHPFPSKPPSPNPMPRGTGVYGYVLVEPACRTSNQPCNDLEQFALATIAAKDTKSGDTKAGVTSSSGRFVIPLHDGTYQVAVSSASAPGLAVRLCHPSNVLVTKGSYSYLHLSCIGA